MRTSHCGAKPAPSLALPVPAMRRMGCSQSSPGLFHVFAVRCLHPPTHRNVHQGGNRMKLLYSGGLCVAAVMTLNMAAFAQTTATPPQGGTAAPKPQGGTTA